MQSYLPNLDLEFPQLCTGSDSRRRVKSLRSQNTPLSLTATLFPMSTQSERAHSNTGFSLNNSVTLIDMAEIMDRTTGPYRDKNVLSLVPQHAKVISGDNIPGKEHETRHAITTYIVTASIAAHARKAYILKCTTQETGRKMVEGEFAAMTPIHKVVPDFISEPIGHGQLESAELPTFFILSSCIEFTDKLADPTDFCSRLSKLHEKSISPTGEFGFHVETFRDGTPQTSTMHSSWTIYYVKIMAHALEADRRFHDQ